MKSDIFEKLSDDSTVINKKHSAFIRVYHAPTLFIHSINVAKSVLLVIYIIYIYIINVHILHRNHSVSA